METKGTRFNLLKDEEGRGNQLIVTIVGGVFGVVTRGNETKIGFDFVSFEFKPTIVL
jgi:hypothetical protein